MTDWTQWRERRPPSRVLHLDTGAAGRQSLATLEAAAAHARAEAEEGAYVAQLRAQEIVDGLRTDLGGLIGVPAEGVAFVESGSSAAVAVLDSWPLPAGATIGVVAAEWGPNLEVFGQRGLRVTRLAADGLGRIDPDALRTRLTDDPPDVVHLTAVSSHRAVVQPVAEAAAACRAAGVPCWVDAAQAVGHVPVDCGADVVYGTSRKWLNGPRGVGFVAVADHQWDRLRPLRPAMAGEQPPVRYLESREAHVAGRVALARAVREFLADGPARIYDRLAEVGRATRAGLAAVPGWAVADDPSAGGAISGLRPTRGQDVIRTRARLLDEHAVLVTAGAIARAPWDMTEPLLRISPHVDCTPDDVERLARALAAID